MHLAQVGQRPRTLSKQTAFNTSFVLNSLYFLGAMSAQQVVTPCHPAIRQTNPSGGPNSVSINSERAGPCLSKLPASPPDFPVFR